jgi:glycosyltransferase involved in cell wall biosynthesis
MKSFLIEEDERYNASDRAEKVLDYVLDDTSETTVAARANEVSVEDELRKERLIKDVSTRIRSRVLFVTNDKTVLESDTPTQVYFKNLTEVFDEVHIIVLGLKKRNIDTIRIAKKAWVYPTMSKYFLQQPFTAYSVAKQQLRFTDGFRPDIVVALDPFESGIAGYFIARKFKRAFQLHVTEDFLTDVYREENEYNRWRLRFARFVLKRALSVRVSTGTLLQKIVATYTSITDLAVLPKYFNIQGTMQAVASMQTEKLYPQFAFTILFVGELDHNSTLFRALDAARPLLRTPSIGFVVIGDGPVKKEFQERTHLLSIDAQVLFVPKVTDVLPHMRSADVLICTDTTSESDEVVIQAAAAGLPLVMAHTSLRDDLFTDGRDAFLCEPDDTSEFSKKMAKFLNVNAMRSQFSEIAKDIVAKRIEEDPKMYRISVRDSIESVLYLEQAAQVRAEVEQQKKVSAEVVKKEKEAETEKAETEKVEKRQTQRRKKSLEKTSHGIDMNIPKM